MKTLKKILLVIVIIIGLITVVGLFLPKEVHMERSKVFSAPKEAVYAQFNELKSWEKWSAWARYDENSIMTYSDPSNGVNAWYTWEGKKMGKGKLTIIEAKPNDFLKFKMDFDGQGTSFASILLEETEGGTKATWTFDNDMGWNIIGRYFGLFMDKMLGPDYENGLNNLDSVLKANPAPMKSAFKIEEVEVAETPILAIRVACKESEIGMHLGRCYGEISKVFMMQKLTPTGYPFAIYYKWEGGNYEFDAGMKFTTAGKDAGSVKASKIQASKAVKVVYMGNYAQSGLAHDAAHQYIKEKGLTEAGAPWEEYVTDPGTEKDTAKWQTDIYYPIK